MTEYFKLLKNFRGEENLEIEEIERSGRKRTVILNGVFESAENPN